MRKGLILTIILLFIFGCVAPQRLQTESGKPEITLSGIPKKKIINVFTGAIVSKGFNAQHVDEYRAVFGKRMEGDFAAAMLYGSRYDSEPEYRISLYFIDVPTDEVKIIFDLAIITNPGSSFERRTDMNSSKDARDFQTMLDDLKYKIESANRPK